jgi:hypothetical protein
MIISEAVNPIINIIENVFSRFFYFMFIGSNLVKFVIFVLTINIGFVKLKKVLLEKEEVDSSYMFDLTILVA